MHSHNSLRTVLKDQLRTVRYIARDMKESLDRFNGDGIVAKPLRSVADLSDRALSYLEDVAQSLRQSSVVVHYGQALPLLRDPTPDKAKSFTRLGYSAIKRALKNRGIANLAISESAIAHAYQIASSPRQDQIDAHTHRALAAALTMAIVKVRPVTFPTTLGAVGERGLQDSNLFAACTLSLAALAAVTDEEITDTDSDLIEAAAIGVDVMYDEFVKAMTNTQRLAELLSNIAPHLH